MQRFEHRFPAMGIEIKLIAYAASQSQFEEAKRAAIATSQRLESIFSNYNKESECEKLQDSAPHSNPVRVSNEMLEVLVHSQRINELTNHAFDPTIGAVTHLWRMARKRNRLPVPEKLTDAMQQSGWSKIQLDSNEKTILIKQKGLRFDFGGIAKGYAADKVLDVFKNHNIVCALVDFGGDIVAGEKPPGSNGWLVKIRSGHKKHKYDLLALENCAVATSGDSQQRLTKNSVRYSHIIDPRSGKALENSCSVTIIGRNGTIADALASAISVLGPEQGMKTLQKFPHAFARIACGQENKIFKSDGFVEFQSRN